MRDKGDKKMKILLSPVMLILLILANQPRAIQNHAKTPPYLSQFPTVERVKAEVKGTDPVDTAARQQEAFWLLNQMITEVAGPRFDNDELTKAEEDLRSLYGEAFQWYQYKERAPSPQDQPRANKLLEFYEKDPGFLDDLLKRFFTPAFRAGYYRTTKKQPPGSSQNAQANPSSGGAAATGADLGFPTEPTAVLSVTNGFRDPAAGKTLTNMPLYLFNDSFASLLKRTRLLDGAPGAKTKVTPLRIWATACFTSSPLCNGVMSEIQGHMVGVAKMDATGRATFQAVPPGSYYVAALTALNQQPVVWDLRVDIKSGANSVSLDQGNTAAIDSRVTPTAARSIGQSATGASAGTAENVPPAAPRPIGPKNSTLTIAASNGRNPVAGTYLYLLDDDAEQILKRANFQQQMLLGKPLPLLNSFEFVSRMVALQQNDPRFKLLEGLGGESLIPPEVKRQYDLGVEALSQHVVGYVKTNAAGRASFPTVPAGTYYIYGTTSHYVKVGEVVTIDRTTPAPTVTKDRDFGYDAATIWNLKVSIKPGPNSTTLSQANAAFVTGRT
jgi:hypothetical protein